VRVGSTPNGDYENFQDFQDQHSALLLEIGSYIERGAAAFLAAEYKFIAVFVVAMAIVIFLAVE